MGNIGFGNFWAGQHHWGRPRETMGTMDLAMLDDFCARGLQSPESTTTHKLSRVRNSSEWYHIAGEAMRCDACDIVETPMPLNARRPVISLAVL